MVSRKATAVAGLSAIALAASGCSGDSDTEAESTPATTTEQVETQPPSAVDIAKLRAAFKERYGTPGDEASWWGHITGMKVPSVNEGHRTLVISTDLDEIGLRLQGMMCGAGFAVARDSGAFEGIEAVVVKTSDGEEGGCA